MRHENKFDKESVGFDSVSKPSVIFLLQELFLKKAVRICSVSEIGLDCSLKGIKLS
jgi:hypothetical protein